jgi:NADP-dependent 3-hydroxy acid dehydrogenase YdfG
LVGQGIHLQPEVIVSMPSRKSTVVITGASAGVGRALGHVFARKGWRVGVVARGAEGLQAVASEIRAMGGEALILKADVADPGAMHEVADKVIEVWGGIDIWINNAMVTVFGPASAIEPEEFKRVTEVTYLGQVYGTQAALRHMTRAGQGTIVSIGSALAYRSIPLQSAYCGAKAATRGFNDSLRSELVHDGSPIRLTMIHLPAVNTPQFDWARCKMDRQPRPVAPVFEPEAVAEQIYQGALSAPRELWIGMPTVKTIIGGLVLPGLTDRLAASQAYEGQLDSKPVSPSRKDNLFNPVEREAATEGRFNSESSSWVGAISGLSVRLILAGAGLGLMSAVALAARRYARR